MHAITKKVLLIMALMVLAIAGWQALEIPTTSAAPCCGGTQHCSAPYKYCCQHATNCSPTNPGYCSLAACGS